MSPNIASRTTSTLTSFRTPANRLDWILAGVIGAKWVYDRYREKADTKRDTVLRFSSDDTPFYWLMRWLEKMPRQKDLGVFKVMVRQTETLDEDTSTPVLVPTEGVTFSYRGVKCSIEKVTQEQPGNATTFRPEVQVRLRTRDLSICEHLLKDIEAVARMKDTPKVYVHQRWGWSAVRKIPEGRVAILPDRQLEDLIEDVQAFKQSERWYQMTGLPYRRGYLLEGISGSGKTSTVIAVATEFNLNVCLLALSGYTDETLADAVRQLPTNSILLLEDIDCAWDSREPKDRITFSGLLNVLDGAATPDGRLTFQTTNHRERLDPALIRPGRVDYEINFGHATAKQIDEMATRFSPTAKGYGRKWKNDQLSMAEVQERLVKIYRPHVSG